MSRTRKARAAFGDTAVAWFVAAIGLAAAFVLDTKEQPQKWHAAIMWTGCAFGAVVIVSRAKWMSWRFWLSWTICLTAHIFLMWVIFEKALSRIRLGTIFVILPALIESLLLSGIISRIECAFGKARKQKRKGVTHS
jgi:hypothetical protein